MIAALLNLAPVPPSTSPVTNTAASPSPEGPANDPFVVAWQRRDRRLRIARNTTAGVAGASLVGLLTAEALGSEPPLLIGLGACLAVSLLGTAAAGGIRREHLQDRPSALRRTGGSSKVLAQQ